MQKILDSEWIRESFIQDHSADISFEFYCEYFAIGHLD